MIEMTQLKYIDAFARYGTLSKAAEALDVTQPALTRSMKKIERDAGMPLFIRDARRLDLNPAGRIVAEYASKILQIEEEMLELAAKADRRERFLTLGSCCLSPVNMLYPRITELSGNRTVITRRMTDEELIRRLHDGSCQLGILRAASSDRHIRCRKYLHEQVHICFAADHPLAHRKYVTASDLKGLSILMYDTGFWTELCREKMPDTAFLLQTDPDTMDELVQQTNLPLFNTDLLLAYGFAPADYSYVPLAEDFAETDYFIACLKSEEAEYKDLFQEVCRETAGPAGNR